MNTDEIKELIQIFNESGLGEMEIQRGDNSVRFSRAASAQQVYVAPATSAHVPAHTASSAGNYGTAAAPAFAKPSEVDASQQLVKSPIVGTYYDQPSPGSPPFIKVGDTVEPGQVLCIIESMKLMNEIEAEVAGVITAKLVESGRPVEYGEALFSIRAR